MSARQGKPILRSIGLMSGTSMDGIDVAMIVSDGEAVLERGPAATYGYDASFRRRLADALEHASAIEQRTDRPAVLADLERELTLRHSTAVLEFLAASRQSPGDIDLIGFHGQTVLHRPQRSLTVQLGDGRLLASETGIRVAFDLRAADMAHGGQGAPLVPAYHRALAANLPPRFIGRRPVAFVNIGGVANITWIGADGEMIAFDTGPGNALIDQWLEAKAGIPFDQGGRIASEGRVVAAIAQQYLDDSFFQKAAPKSLDRNDFPSLAVDAASLEDGARTLAHVTAAAIWKAVERVPELPALWIVCGGGRHNRAILSDLCELAAANDRLGVAAEVTVAEDAGFNGDAMEAEAWAYLAIRAFRGLPLTWPGTTGVREPITGGMIVEPSPIRPLPIRKGKQA